MNNINPLIGVCVNHPDVSIGSEFTVDRYFEALREIAKHGFQAIEYSHISHLDVEECSRIAVYTVQLGMKPWSIHSEHLNDSSDEAVEEYIAIQEICARNAKALTCKCMVVHPPNTKMSLERKADILREVAKISASYGIGMAVENVGEMPSDLVLALANLIDHDNCGFIIDTGHAQFLPEQKGGVLNAISDFAGRIWSVHLHDNYGKNDDHQPPGLGIGNWRAIISALWDAGYSGPLIVELTAPSVKAKRSSPELRALALEKEQCLAANYLKYIVAELNEQQNNI